jgi:hypothetical protein
VNHPAVTALSRRGFVYCNRWCSGLGLAERGPYRHN